MRSFGQSPISIRYRSLGVRLSRDFSIRDHEAAINSIAPKPQGRESFPGKAVDNDPLAEFYDQARKELREQKDVSPVVHDLSYAFAYYQSSHVLAIKNLVRRGPLPLAQCRNLYVAIRPGEDYPNLSFVALDLRPETNQRR